jgi:hypothetical protein
MKRFALLVLLTALLAAACGSPPATTEPAPTATEALPTELPTAPPTETPLPSDTPEPTAIPSDTATPEPSLSPTWDVFFTTTPPLPPGGESLSLAEAPPLVIVNQSDEQLLFILASPHYNEFSIAPSASLRVRIWPGTYTFLAALESVYYPGTFTTKIEKTTIYVDLDGVRVSGP